MKKIERKRTKPEKQRKHIFFHFKVFFRKGCLTGSKPRLRELNRLDLATAKKIDLLYFLSFAA